MNSRDRLLRAGRRLAVGAAFGTLGPSVFMIFMRYAWQGCLSMLLPVAFFPPVLILVLTKESLPATEELALYVAACALNVPFWGLFAVAFFGGKPDLRRSRSAAGLHLHWRAVGCVGGYLLALLAIRLQEPEDIETWFQRVGGPMMLGGILVGWLLAEGALRSTTRRRRAGSPDL